MKKLVEEVFKPIFPKEENTYQAKYFPLDTIRSSSTGYDCGVFENNIEKLISIPVDVRVMNAAPLSFQYQVIHDGRVMIDREPQHRAEYEGQILKQYFDFSRYRKRYLKEAVYAPL